jgi:hypothetical protein
MSKKKKFLCIYRSPKEAPAGTKPSPEEMQAAMAEWQVWKARFDEELIDMGAKLEPEGMVYKSGTVTDGPFIEARKSWAAS